MNKDGNQVIFVEDFVGVGWVGHLLVGFYRERRWNQADFVSSSWLFCWGLGFSVEGCGGCC